MITAAAPPALPAAAGLAARLPPPGAPSSSGPSSSPLLPPPLLLLQRSGRSRFLPAGPPRLRGPARAVPLPELGSSQAAPFFLGMVAGCRDTGAQCKRAGGGAGEGSAARRGPPHLLLPRPSPRRAPRGDPRRPSPAPSTCEHARKEELSWAPCPAPVAPHSPRLLFFFLLILNNGISVCLRLNHVDPPSFPFLFIPFPTPPPSPAFWFFFKPFSLGGGGGRRKKKKKKTFPDPANWSLKVSSPYLVGVMRKGRGSD